MPNAERPLYAVYPALQRHLPCAGFAQLPTPVQQHTFSGRPVWIKRDDLTHSLYGGNKVRKLEFILAAAKAAGQRRVVTFGATGTHHGLATALFCRELGLDCELLLFEQEETEHVHANRKALAAAGADCVECGSLGNTVRRFYLHPRRLRGDTLFLFAGGSGVAGTLAFVNAALELKQQIEAGEACMPDRLYVACSSGSTLAGLTLGAAIAELSCEVIGVQVADSHLGPFQACTEDTVSALIRKTMRWLNKHQAPCTLPCPGVRLESRFLGAGYGFPAAGGASAATQFQQAVAVPLDETYTAKAFAGLLADDSDGALMYWHTLSSV